MRHDQRTGLLFWSELENIVDRGFAVENGLALFIIEITPCCRRVDVQLPRVLRGSDVVDRDPTVSRVLFEMPALGGVALASVLGFVQKAAIPAGRVKGFVVPQKMINAQHEAPNGGHNGKPN